MSNEIILTGNKPKLEKIRALLIIYKKMLYIQSLDSLLEFEPIEDIEYNISSFAQKKARKKEVFLRERNE